MNRAACVETFAKTGQVENASDAEQCTEFENANRTTSLSSPIPLPAYPRRIATENGLFYQNIFDSPNLGLSARYLSKSHTPTAGSILAQKMESTPALDSIHENFLVSAIATQSAPASSMKSTFCVVSTLTFLGAINLLQPLNEIINPMVLNPRQQFVIHIGRKLFQVGDDQMLKTDASGSSSVGTFLGWAMTFVYMGGRLPQICLNIRRGHVEGLNPFMFIFAVLGNTTYVASILLISLDWAKIKPNLPWLVDAAGLYISTFGPPMPCRVNAKSCLCTEEETRIISLAISTKLT
ncbi:unnamed protein product [Sphenostylis stenocarpa]|uniref:Uncharacterized protein n=1 Tax=Sphenostylis stenocarpa TaxID=92480 RepID=A0AA86S586_9FABA|nr:unnamed protein product [Sphenostylis stenocarpa]